MVFNRNRRLLTAARLLFIWATVIATGFAHAITTDIPKGNITIDLQPVCDGFVAPVTATHAGDRSRRLFIVDQPGTVHVYDQAADRCLEEPFLDISDRVVTVNPGFDERGLLGLAFHPRFRHNGRFYVRYSAPRAGTPDEPCFDTTRGCHTSVLSEFRVDHRHANRADPASERLIFAIDVPQFNHNSGHVAFGPDGLLYFGLGDGGGANDGLADIPPTHGPIGNGQNIDTALGGILRIDVNRRDPGLNYAIPGNNPFAGAIPGVDEIFAYGMRNPYRFSFDAEKRRGNRRNHKSKRDGGDLYVADVGQAGFEEVNLVRKGGNYGWVIAEGFHCFDPFAPEVAPGQCNGTGPHGEPLLNPIAEYNHNDGIAIVGGFVYRGDKHSSLYGKYVFGDFSRSFVPADGRLFWLDTTGVRSDIFEFRIGDLDLPLGQYLFGFGEDERGELFALTSSNFGPRGVTGQVWRIVVPGDMPMHHEDDDKDDHDD